MNLQKPKGFTYDYGTRLQKKKGSSWHGIVTGFYSNDITPEGYCITSEREEDSTQLYPLQALEPLHD